MWSAERKQGWKMHESGALCVTARRVSGCACRAAVCCGVTTGAVAELEGTRLEGLFVPSLAGAGAKAQWQSQDQPSGPWHPGPWLPCPTVWAPHGCVFLCV